MDYLSDADKDCVQEKIMPINYETLCSVVLWLRTNNKIFTNMLRRKIKSFRTLCDNIQRNTRMHRQFSHVRRQNNNNNNKAFV